MYVFNFDQKVEGRKVIYLGVRRVLYSKVCVLMHVIIDYRSL